MTHERIGRLTKVASALGLALALLLTVAGCCEKPASTTKQTAAQKAGTAQAGLRVATSAVSVVAPDARLLFVRTATSVAPSATPVWTYVFGSPKDDKSYIVYVTGGKATPASGYGAAGLSKSEWPSVPSVSSWKIDSDEAYQKAMAVREATDAPASYVMGFFTYIRPSEVSSTNKAFVWYVEFEPRASGATTGTAGASGDASDAARASGDASDTIEVIRVDMETGVAKAD